MVTCAFDDAGLFTAKNFNCRTMMALTGLGECEAESGEYLLGVLNLSTIRTSWVSFLVYTAKPSNGFRHILSAVIMAGTQAPQPLTLATSEKLLADLVADLDLVV